jgi:hypothetical protein
MCALIGGRSLKFLAEQSFHAIQAHGYTLCRLFTQ